jgi:hypothetical protein
MTRDEAIMRLQAAVQELPSGPKQTAAQRALHDLLRQVEDGARKRVVEARSDLLSTLPRLRPAVDRVIAERFASPTPIPRSRKRR